MSQGTDRRHQIWACWVPTGEAWFIVQLTAMSISFYVHLYFDKHYHVAGSWLGRFAWFRRKQQLHFLHHRHADCNFAVVDNFWDWLLGTYRSIDAHRET